MGIKKFLLALFVFLFSCGTAAAQVNEQSAEIHKLRKTVIKLTNEHKKILSKNELRTNHTLARYQSKLFIKVATYEIDKYLRQEGIKRSLTNIEKMVTASYLSSWVFKDLGKDHIERFVNMMQWAKDETGFRPQTRKFWKAGTYLPSIDKKVLRDSWDYGGWQINEQHMDDKKFLSLINFLYDSGVINFEIKHVKERRDFLDINTNCIARCIIETDRKKLGWEWKHIRDVKFRKHIQNAIAKIEAEGLYDRDFVEEYYYITPIRNYSASKMHTYK